MITLEQAKALKYRDILYHVSNRNYDGSPQRWRVNGPVKTWVTRPNEILVPIKHVLRNCYYLTHDELHLVCLTEAEALEEE